MRGNWLPGHAPGSALGVLLLESRIVSFVTLAADFVQAAQRGGVELKNGGSPAVYSGKYIGVVTLVLKKSFRALGAIKSIEKGA